MVGLDNPIHLAFLLLIVLLVFGAKRLPEIGRSLGSGLRGFKESVSGEIKEPSSETSDAAPSRTETAHLPATPASDAEVSSVEHRELTPAA